MPALPFDLGAPSSDAGALRRLGATGVLEAKLAARLARAAGFRRVVANAYESLDLAGCIAPRGRGRRTPRRSSPRSATGSEAPTR
jgi:hypothetical protein